MIRFGNGKGGSGGGGGGGATELIQLTDVDATNIAAGRYLTVGPDGATHVYAPFPDIEAGTDPTVLNWEAGDQTARIQTALDTYGRIRLGEGVWEISSELNMPDAGQLFGSGMFKTAIKATVPDHHAIVATEVSHVVIADLTVQDVAMLSEESAERHGIRFVGCTDSVVQNVRVSNCGDAGIRFGNTTGANFGGVPSRNCWAISCIVEDSPNGAGVEIMVSEYCRVVNCTVRRVFHHGIRVAGSAGCIVMGNHLIDNATSDISMQGYSGLFQGTNYNKGASRNVIVGNYLYSDYPSVPELWGRRGIELYYNSNTCVVEGNLIRHKQTGINFRSPDEQGSYDNIVVGNTIRDCNYLVEILGNTNRISFRNNIFKNWRNPEAVIIDQGTMNELMDDILFEHNEIVCDQDSAKGVITVATSTSPFRGTVYFFWNRVFLYKSRAQININDSGLGTIETTWNGVETNRYATDAQYKVVWTGGGDAGDVTTPAGDTGALMDQFSDSFNRPNQELSYPWMNTIGHAAVDNFRLAPKSVSNGVLIVSMVGSTDGAVAANVTTGLASQTGSAGVVFRMSDDGLNGWWARMARDSQGGMTVELRKFINGVLQSASVQGAMTVGDNEYHTIEATFFGSTLQLVLDGTQVGSDITDDFNSTSKRVGIRLGMGVPGGQRAYDFAWVGA